MKATSPTEGVTSCHTALPAVFPGYGSNADPASTSTGTRFFASDARGTIVFDNASTIA